MIAAAETCASVGWASSPGRCGRFLATARLIVTMPETVRRHILPLIRSGLVGLVLIAANLPATVYAHDSMADENATILIGAVVALMGVVVIAAIAILSERRRNRRRRRGSRSQSQLRRSR
jgi:hypothetical protein